MSDTPIIFAYPFGRNKREVELQASLARSHAAKFSSARGVVTRWANRASESKERKRGLACLTQPRRRHQDPTRHYITAGRPQEDRQDPPELPRPQTLLGQGQVDPFEADPDRKLSLVARQSLEYAMRNIFTATTPMASQAALDRQITQWRALGVQSALEFHTQVSTAASLCYSLSTDPRVMRDLLLTRWTHQTIALKLVREAIESLSGPPSESLIDCLDRLASQGGRVYTAASVRRYRETPIAAVLPNLKAYGRFEPCIPHWQALRYLIRQKGGFEALSSGVAKPLSMADTVMSSKWATRPIWPLHKDYRIAANSQRFSFDPQASIFRQSMGSGWIDLQRNHPQIVNMALRAAELTVALDQAVRGGNGCLTLGQMSLLAFVFQYDLCNLNPDMKNLLLAAGSSPWDQLSMICLFGLQIYSDVVLFPNAEFYGIRPRLARWLQAALTAHRLTEDSSTDLSYWEVILWATVMGAVAAEGTRHRHWYLFQLSTIMVDRELSWESLQDHLRRFLWWDYTFDERLSKIWEDARAVAITGNKGGGPVISDK